MRKPRAAKTTLPPRIQRRIDERKAGRSLSLAPNSSGTNVVPIRSAETHTVRPVAPGEMRFNRILSDAELVNIPLVEPTTLEISDKETAKLRRRLYSINKDSVAYRFRTMRENGLTLLWRLTRY
jgi:hypothetical protein